MISNKLRELVLLTLEGAVDYAIDLADYYSNPKRFLYWQPKYSKSALSASIARLRKKGLVEKVIDEEKVILRLTEAGQEWLLQRKEETDVPWDGIFRIVIFDIPEKHKNIREVLRNTLKRWEFVKWQKSVWVSKKPLTKKIRELVEKLGVRDWVLVIESDNTGK